MSTAEHAKKNEQKTTNTGLTTVEEIAHKKCVHLACANEACIKQYLYRSTQEKQQLCGHLFAQWKECFETHTAVNKP